MSKDCLLNKAAPKYGMGTGVARGKPNRDTLMTPAPNTYSPSKNQTLNKSPSWMVGTSKRRPLSSRNANPGPGNYNLTASSTGPAVIIKINISLVCLKR